MAVGGAILVARNERALRVAARMSAGSIAAETIDDRKEQFLATLDKVGQIVAPGEASRPLKEQLASAGFFSPIAAAAFLGAKALLFVLGILMTVMLSVALRLELRTSMIVGIFLCAGMFFLPNIVVDMRRKQRRDEIRRHLPDAIDLLEISVSAGMGLDQAWNAVTNELHSVSTILADEMALTNLEMHLGAQRAVAMRHLADRTSADELSSLVAVLVQSERFGTSISDAMRQFAGSMREARSHRAQEEAETMAVKLIFPMIIFLFPAVVLITAGPAGISLMKAIKP
jgi:tight adherence protein C